MRVSGTGEVSDERLIDLIYDSPFDDRLWTPLLSELADRCGAHPANITELNVIEGHGDGLSVRTPSDTLQVYRTRWTQANPLLLVDNLFDYSAGWTPRILRDNDWIDRDDFERSAYMNEFLIPIEASYNLTMRLSLEGPWLTTIGLGRPKRKGQFETRDIAAIAPFHSHLIRASRVRRLVALQQSQLDRLDVLLEDSSHALFFVADDLRVIRCTAAAEAIIRDNPLFRLVNGRLRATVPAANASLEMALQAAFRSGPPPEPLLLQGLRPDSNLSITISRMSERIMAGFSTFRCLLVAVSKSSPTQSTSHDILRERFGMTGAEARLALSLLAGASLQATADQNTVSIHTIRNQLKSVFHKTGCSRQQDLIRALIALDLPSCADG
ncbi:helix-turn-helix transcriptional regulator [Sphingomonas echinoides]|uniref:Helix-turn-helix transcriptional regulator n=1 Tax=Sphingomonas echinoides TaxID=59803 RepID=A0ABU4PI77_9SPHN|nr:helix-turn-helix transcriptional regulator [Sphingomonas echinoides]MDX5983674.1 helix-turn-helix transcriptional regulator [Sphingomonas echinoides]